MGSFLENEKDKIQKEALNSIILNEGNGIIAAATGAGKTKIAIDYIELLRKSGKKIFLWVVPTEKLRDEGIKQEFAKWGSDFSNLRLICYASLNKVKDLDFDLVVMDEVHHITENNFKFFKNNKINKVLGLTATPPSDYIKQQLLDNLDLKTIYKLSLDDAVKKGVVAPYKLKIIEVDLDNTDKYLPAGNKTNRFYTTEKAQYSYISKQIQRMQFTENGIPAYLMLSRMKLIYSFKSKISAAKKLLNTIPKDERYLIFHKSINQIEELCENTYHTKVSDEKYNLFLKGKINSLGVIDKINEGTNIDNLDKAIIVQLNSQPRELIQRRFCAFVQ